MSTLDVVACLQVVIILLLIEPQERRKSVLGWLFPLGAACVAVWYLSSTVFGLLFEAIRPIKERFGWSSLFIIAVALVYAVSLVFAYLIDAKQNRNIKAGSKEAFNNRVAYLMHDRHYSNEDAIAAVTKLRDEKKK